MLPQTDSISELILEPGRYEGVPVYQLLQSAGHGFIPVDQRLLHAILDFPENSLPDLLRFAAQDHSNDLMDLDPLLIDLFRALRTPAALPFFMRVIRDNPSDVSDDLVESIVELGEPSVEPLLSLFRELDGKDSGDVPFVLAALRVRDARVLKALTGRLVNEPLDASICLEMYGDPAAVPALEAALAQIPPEDPRSRPLIQTAIEHLSAGAEGLRETAEPFDIWELYPEEAATDFSALEDEDRFAMLDKGTASLRAEVALSYEGTDLSDEARARLILLAKTDPDPTVRGAGWEALGEIGDEPGLRQAMLKILADPNRAIEERSGVAVGLAEQTDNVVVYQAILNLYEDPRGRAKALKAMARSFDKRFAAYPPQHLDDPDPDVKRQSIWGIGYLGLTSEAPRLAALFDDEEYRADALFAYTLAIPGETSPGRVRALMAKVEQAAGGFREDEEDLVRIALDQRLMLHGKSPVFFPDDLEEEELDSVNAAPKPGRNDLCSCGSGKKYKKCHGLLN